MAQNCNCNLEEQTNQVTSSMEDYIKQKQNIEDQTDYRFIQRIIQELTQSCALNIPIPASAIPPLIIQAAQFFWQNDDRAVEERWYCLPNSEFRKFGPNQLAKLPSQIISVFGCYKATNNFNYAVMGDFSLERMILNNSALAAGAGGSLGDVFGSGTGYNLTDVTAALYEVETFKAMFNTPLTYNYNEFSNELIILGALDYSDLILQTWQRCKIQDLYKDYYFFRYKRSNNIFTLHRYKPKGKHTIRKKSKRTRFIKNFSKRILERIKSFTSMAWQKHLYRKKTKM